MERCRVQDSQRGIYNFPRCLGGWIFCRKRRQGLGHFPVYLGRGVVFSMKFRGTVMTTTSDGGP